MTDETPRRRYRSPLDELEELMAAQKKGQASPSPPPPEKAQRTEENQSTEKSQPASDGPLVGDSPSLPRETHRETDRETSRETGEKALEGKDPASENATAKESAADLWPFEEPFADSASSAQAPTPASTTRSAQLEDLFAETLGTNAVGTSSEGTGSERTESEGTRSEGTRSEGTRSETTESVEAAAPPPSPLPKEVNDSPEPSAPEFSVSEPVVPEPVLPEPLAPEPLVPEPPVILEPIALESAIPEPVVPEPSVSGPIVPEPTLPASAAPVARAVELPGSNAVIPESIQAESAPEARPPAAGSEGKRQTLAATLATVREGRGRAAQAALSRKLSRAEAQPGLEELLIRFRAGGIAFAVPMAQIAEIGERPRLTRVPGLPTSFPGVANLQGEVVLAIDLPTFLLPQKRSKARHSLLIHNRDRELMGVVLVDEVHGIAPFDREGLNSPAAQMSHVLTAHEQGAIDFQGRSYAVVNLLAWLRSDEINAQLETQL
ncbi:MAG: chemotaxis protein CheW [Deltaproteobacteria bacterium]|nr:chemotaxis protein CheW [Deltaproteobacteria bacterium]